MDKKRNHLGTTNNELLPHLTDFVCQAKTLPTPPLLNNRQHKTGWNSIELYIIQTGITCKKISFYMHDSDCRWLIVKNAKKF